MTQWHNRISGYGEEAPDTLLANPRNFRRHPKHQQDALAGVLRDVGVVQNVIVNRTTGLVVDGHARIALAVLHKQIAIPITYVELSEAEEAIILATLDALADMATIDAAILENLLRDVTTGDAAVQAMLDALAVDAGIVEPQSVDDMWQGMPDFEQQDQEAWKRIIVHFDNEQDYHDFAQNIRQTLTPQTKSIWYPKRANEPFMTNRCTDEP